MLPPDKKTKLYPHLKALHKVVEDAGLMASIVISDGKHCDMHLAVDPTWSVCASTRVGDKRENLNVAVSLAGEDIDKISKTTNGLVALYQGCQEQMQWLSSIMEQLKFQMKIADSGERWFGKGDAPDPEVTPDSLKGCSAFLIGLLSPDQAAWARKTPLYDAMPKLGDKFGAHFRSKWSSGGTLLDFTSVNYGLFGHPDDINTLILTHLWGEIGCKDDDEIEKDLIAEVEGMKAHWRSQGINPETGAKSIIV